ncbi:MAG TPA: FtsX-like permease family protein [Symbiobacteriaceae bacterium]|nr:FtsX-like permease family protein [Symbiobacteriaceae bacterium]
MKLRLLRRRWRGAAGLTGLRLCGLVLAALLTAAVPVFVSGAMEQVLHRTLTASGDGAAAVVAWTAPDDDVDHSAGLGQLNEYLASFGPVEQMLSTGPLGVQQRDAAGQLLAGKKYYRLAALPSGVQVQAGRLPEPGKPEVLVPAKTGYEVGTRLRLPLDQPVEVTVVGVAAAAGGPLDGALLVSGQYWESLGAAVGEAVWTVAFPADRLHAAEAPALAGALAELPVRVQQYLSGAEVVETPLQPIADFVRQMAATQQFLFVLLTPVFLLILFFVSATAGAVVESRKVEIAVLRSRGMSPWRTVAFYLPESLALAAAAWGTALLLTPATVRVMGLSAGFLQLVGRPPMPAGLSATAVLLALGAAVAAEAVALIPLARATGFSVVTLRQEAATHSVALAALQGAGEAALLGLVAYGTWRAGSAGVANDLLMWALPPLALAVAGLIFLRLFEPAVRWLGRLVRPWLSPPAFLALTLLERPPARHRILALMLVLTTGLGVYGAAFARTLDLDLVARTEYRVGADLTLRTVWESEVLEMSPEGEATSMAYREPPFSELEAVPGAAALAKVQTRREVGFVAGSRSLGKMDLVGITPVEFGQVARFLTDLTPGPAASLNALAADEQAVLVSGDLARRAGLKPGDRLTARQGESEAALVVAGIVPFWPGRLPEQGEFVVGSLLYLQDLLGLAPYDVWVRLAPGTDAAAYVGAVSSYGVRLATVADAPSQLAAGRREPFRLGIYATLSTGFVVALAAMVLTYLLASGLTLQSRAKELGVLRAMGMGARQVAMSLYVEQLAVVASAAAAGLGAGALAAGWYVPVFRQQPGETVLPVRIAAVAGDRWSLVLSLAVALAVGVLMIRAQMRRLNVGAVLRLGEDG